MTPRCASPKMRLRLLLVLSLNVGVVLWLIVTYTSVATWRVLEMRVPFSDVIIQQHHLQQQNQMQLLQHQQYQQQPRQQQENIQHQQQDLKHQQQQRQHPQEQLNHQQPQPKEQLHPSEAKISTAAKAVSESNSTIVKIKDFSKPLLLGANGNVLNGMSALSKNLVSQSSKYDTLFKSAIGGMGGSSGSGSKCPNILSGMTEGQWVTRNLTTAEEKEVGDYLKKERGDYRIPPTFQRQDGKCGNLSYPGSPKYPHMWLKAICDPKGKTPCCHSNQCVAMSEKECRCPTCYDERQSVHAEYSTWTASDVRCQATHFKPEEACRVMKGRTVHFVGDSFVRHMFIAMVITLTGNTRDGALKRTAHPLLKARCHGWYQITGITCRALLDEDRTLCNGTVHVKYTQIFPSKDFRVAYPVLQSLRNNNQSLVVLGIGIHDNLNVDTVARRFLLPFLNLHQIMSANKSREVQLEDVITNFGSLDLSAIAGEILTNTTDNPLPSMFEYLKQYDAGEILRALGIGHFPGRTFDILETRSASEILKALGIETPSTQGGLFNTSLINNTGKTFAFQPLILDPKKSKTVDSSTPVVFKNSSILFNLLPEPDLNTDEVRPRLLWVGTHAPGLLKSDHFEAQSANGVRHYNRGINTILNTWRVSYLDTFSFTNGVVSHDGTHYGWGVNMLKTNMLLTFIKQLSS